VTVPSKWITADRTFVPVSITTTAVAVAALAGVAVAAIAVTALATMNPSAVTARATRIIR